MRIRIPNTGRNITPPLPRDEKFFLFHLMPRRHLIILLSLRSDVGEPRVLELIWLYMTSSRGQTKPVFSGEADGRQRAGHRHPVHQVQERDADDGPDALQPLPQDQCQARGRQHNPRPRDEADTLQVPQARPPPGKVQPFFSTRPASAV